MYFRYIFKKMFVSAGMSSGPGDLNVVAMAISGFTGDDRNTLWRDQCRSIGASLRNPYLRALFAFLTIGSGESYEAVLVSYVLTVCISASAAGVGVGTKGAIP